MKKLSIRPIAWLMLFVMVVSLACSLSAPAAAPTSTSAPAQAPTSTTVKEATAEPTKEATVETKATATQAADTSTKGAVTTLEGVQSATIQIEAEGTFIDPKVGLMVNAAGRGSGFIIDPSGLAITNNHVVTGAALLRVWIGGDKSKEYDAQVIAASECSDLALIKIVGDNFPYLTWHDGDPKVSMHVYTAGFPLGEPEFAMTDGIISKAATPGATGWASVKNVLMHSATINPGNSGGPLVDDQGKLVGINYAGNEAKQYFAIAKTEADLVLKDLKAGKDVTSIGVNGEAVVGTLPNGKDISGIWVSSVKSGSPADKAMIQPGDIINQIEGEVMAVDGTMELYCKVLRSHKASDTLSLTVVRWDTQEILQGQLNGRTLSAVASSFFENQLGSQVGNTGNTSGGYTYETITDDAGLIQVDVPVEWTDRETNKRWSSEWNGVKFDAPYIEATTDLNAYDNGYDTPGMFFAASSELSKAGGYANLLEGTRSWHRDNCSNVATYDYSDDVYEGKYDFWTGCGSSGTYVLVLSVRPKANPTAYLILVEVKIVSDQDLAAADQILATFQAIR